MLASCTSSLTSVLEIDVFEIQRNRTAEQVKVQGLGNHWGRRWHVRTTQCFSIDGRFGQGRKVRVFFAFQLIILMIFFRYINADYALWMMLRQLQQSLEGAKAIKRLVLTYDIACQFSKNIKARFSEEPFVNTPGIGDMVDMLVHLVPKLHLEGHKSDCKYCYSLNYTRSCCRVDGEAIERAWAENKAIGSSSKEMNHGHRHEVLTALFNDWNWSKMLNTRTLRYWVLT